MNNQEQYNQNHNHNGKNSDFINFSDLRNRQIIIPYTIYGTDAATATNYGVFFTSPVRGYVKSVTEVHQTAGTDGSDVTLNIEKLTGTQALGAGVDILATALSLKATANTVQSGTISTTISNSAVDIGDRLAMKDIGTLTSVANVTVVVEIIY